MKKFLSALGLGGGGDVSSLDEAKQQAAEAGKAVLVDLYVPL